jgi:hypothetical protein
MAAGDAVVGMVAATTWLTFTPAAGVEVMITCFMGASSVYVGQNDGVLDTYSNFVSNNVGTTNFNTKIVCTNAQSLKMYSTTLPSAYSGIQIK